MGHLTQKLTTNSPHLKPVHLLRIGTQHPRHAVSNNAIFKPNPSLDLIKPPVLLIFNMISCHMIKPFCMSSLLLDVLIDLLVLQVILQIIFAIPCGFLDLVKLCLTILLPIKSSGMRHYPLQDYFSCSKFSDKYRVFVTIVYSMIEPAYYHQAFKDSQWQATMIDEINALEWNKTWELTSLPPGKRALICK